MSDDREKDYYSYLEYPFRAIFSRSRKIETGEKKDRMSSSHTSSPMFPTNMWDCSEVGWELTEERGE